MTSELLFQIINGYYLLLGITVIYFIYILNKKEQNNPLVYNIILVFWLPFSIYFLGLRNSDIGTDSENYRSMYEMVVNGEGNDTIDIEYLFYFLMKLTSPFEDYHIFFLSIHLIFVSGLLYFLRLNFEYFVIAFIAYMATFFYYNLSINIVRNSLAIPFWMLAIYYLNLSKNIKGLFFITVSILFHKTSFFILFAYFLTKILSINKLLILWGIVSFCSLIGHDIIITLIEFSPLGDYLQLLKYSQYIDNKDLIDYTIGFRLDFWFINALFIAYLFLTKSLNEENVWVKLFIVMSILAVFAYQFPYSDRTCLFAWFLIPFIFIQRAFKPDRSIEISIFNVVSFCIIISALSFILLSRSI